MEYQPERALIHLLYDDYSLILRTVEMESQPERALIPGHVINSYICTLWCRKGVSARKGIDTFSFLNFTIKRFKCINGALAREGIDTKTESNLVATGFDVEMEPQPERALILFSA